MIKAVIFDFKRTIFDPESGELFPGTKEVLEDLKLGGYKLFLISHGSYPKSLITDLGVESFFDEVLITGDKNIGVFEKIIVKNELSIKKSYVIGDRVKGEIKIGNSLGLKTIWLKKGLFSEELPEDISEVPKYTIKELSEMLKIVL